MTQASAPLDFKVCSAAGAAAAADRARRMVKTIGFEPVEAEEIALVVSELASNLVRHAGGGCITMTALQEGQRKGVQIESADQGPGIEDVELALTDGFSTKGGLGKGLGTVNRLVDQLEFHCPPSPGLRILCQRWVRPQARNGGAPRLDCGAATRARRLAAENGDAIVIRQWADQALLGVIDGLGHGPLAQKAAQAARSYVEHHFDQPLRDVFRGVGRTCKATRGVVMALARLDLGASSLTIAGVGNIEVRLLGLSIPSHIVIRRGILGVHTIEPLTSHHDWNSSAILIMHSDGVQSRWHCKDYSDLFTGTSSVIARRLLQALGTLQDDATVLVARSADS